MPRKKKYCSVHVNHHGNLYLRLYWDREWKEGLPFEDSPPNRKRAETIARRVAAAMEANRFSYLRFFPDGNRQKEFRGSGVPRVETRTTVSSFFGTWIKTLGPPKVRETTRRQYSSLLQRHVLPEIGDCPISALRWEDLAMLQETLRQRGVGAPTINRALHHALRALLRDARRSRESVARDLFDRGLWQRFSEDSDSEPDPYDEAEQRLILDHFRTEKSHWYAFVYFQFFQGTRPSEATALRRRDVDLMHGTTQIRRSRVAASEAPTKTKKSRRTIGLHPNTSNVLRDVWPIHTDPEDYVFRTPTGSPVDQANFQKRIWLPVIRRLGIRERPFYNTRHSYVSYLLSIGKRLAFVSAQTGHSIRTLERYYKKYLPQDDDLTLPFDGTALENSKRAEEA